MQTTSMPGSTHAGPSEPGAHEMGPPKTRSGWRLAIWQFLACTGWLGACVLGIYVGMGYDFQPGALGPSQSHWPADTALKLCPGRVTVVAFLHPRCVCTEATVKQLVQAMRQRPAAKLIAVLFVPPEPGLREKWQGSAYEQTIRAKIPDAQIVLDPGGALAEQFGAATSGTILAYDRAGEEVFRGGITDRRGGEEDNPGLQQFVRVLAEEPSPKPPTPTPVFGCSLQALPVSASGDRGETP